MELKENIVELSDNISPALKFTATNNKLSLQYIQTYFPNATGIKHDSDITLECIDGAFILKPGIYRYDVYYPPKLTNDAKAKSADVKKAKKVREILNIISNSNDVNEECDNSDLFAKPVGLPVKKKIEKPKNVVVGWKHKYIADHYELQCGRLGGMQKIKMFPSISYDFKTVIKDIELAIYNELNRTTLVNAYTKLLGNSDGNLIHKFVDKNNLSTDFWGCQDFFRAKNHMLKIYLYTVPKLDDNSLDYYKLPPPFIHLHKSKSSALSVLSTSKGNVAISQEKENPMINITKENKKRKSEKLDATLEKIAAAPAFSKMKKKEKSL